MGPRAAHVGGALLDFDDFIFNLQEKDLEVSWESKPVKLRERDPDIDLLIAAGTVEKRTPLTSRSRLFVPGQACTDTVYYTNGCSPYGTGQYGAQSAYIQTWQTPNAAVHRDHRWNQDCAQHVTPATSSGSKPRVAKAKAAAPNQATGRKGSQAADTMHMNQKTKGTPQGKGGPSAQALSCRAGASKYSRFNNLVDDHLSSNNVPGTQRIGNWADADEDAAQSQTQSRNRLSGQSQLAQRTVPQLQLTTRVASLRSYSPDTPTSLSRPWCSSSPDESQSQVSVPSVTSSTSTSAPSSATREEPQPARSTTKTMRGIRNKKMARSELSQAEAAEQRESRLAHEELQLRLNALQLEPSAVPRATEWTIVPLNRGQGHQMDNVLLNALSLEPQMQTYQASLDL